MDIPNFTPAFVEGGGFHARAFNDNGDRTVDVPLASRILVALQDPLARRRMTRLLRAQGFRAIALDEPLAAWSMVVENASPRLSGFDFVICGGFRSDCDLHMPRAPGAGARFFLLLGRRGFVPFTTDRSPPPAWAFRRVGTDPIQSHSTPPGSASPIGLPASAHRSHAASIQEQ